MITEIGHQETGDPLTKEEVDEVLASLDDNGDGTISFEGTTLCCVAQPNFQTDEQKLTSFGTAAPRRVQ